MADHPRAEDEVTNVSEHLALEVHYERADGFVRSGLEWLAKHYEASGSSRWKCLPTPAGLVALTVQVADFLADTSDDDDDYDAAIAAAHRSTTSISDVLHELTDLVERADVEEPIMRMALAAIDDIRTTWPYNVLVQRTRGS